MKKHVRFEVITEDRIGIAFKILEKIYRANINLISMEVFPNRVCVKLQEMDRKDIEKFKEDICSIEEVININEIELLNFEKNERKIFAVINSVDEGIISINKNFEIEIFNSYCEEVFHYKRDEVIGKDVRRITGESIPLIDLINEGKTYDNVELHIENERGQSHYITTGRAIKDDNDNTIGGVASIKDIHKAIQLANVVTSTRKGAFAEIVGNSDSIEKVKKMAVTVSKTNSTVLLRGESGTGKELFARAIHNLSDRKSNNFVAINCAALPDSLIESELFGYEKGSFTGAVSSGKEGLFKEADGGTLFLDEIGELSTAMQAKLLRVLQEGVIRKIGSNKEEKVDVRIIGATNKNLEEMVEKFEFREDLYYRLNVIPIYIPPLRDRLEDIPILVGFFLDKLNNRLGKNITTANLEFVNELMKYNWPGNVRELQNVVERAMNLCEGSILSIEHLIISIRDNRGILKKEINGNCELKLEEIVKTCEIEAIVKALEKYKSIRKAAKALGVSHTTVVNKINKYKIGYLSKR
jgi:transcriptional regulator of aroF, aroG, tyrA and aromatic amino acid transport